MKVLVATVLFVVLVLSVNVESVVAGDDGPESVQYPNQDAMYAAENANLKDSGTGYSFSGNLETKEWSAGAAKTVYESNNGDAKLSVGIGANGQGSKVRGGQVGASFRVRF